MGGGMPGGMGGMPGGMGDLIFLLIIDYYGKLIQYNGKVAS